MKEMVDLPSDPNFERFGSSEYTIAMIDEVSEISEKAVEVLFSRLRWRIHETFKTSRMFMSTNRLQTGYVPGSYRMKTETRWNAGRERLIYRSPYSTTRTSLSGRLTRRH